MAYEVHIMICAGCRHSLHKMEDRSRSMKVQTFSIVELQGDFFLLSVSSHKLNLATPSSAVSVDGPFSYIIQFVIFEVSTDS